MLEGEYTEQEMKAIPYFNGIGSVVNPTVSFANLPIIFGKGGRL